MTQLLPLNTTYVDKLIEQIDATNSPVELQTLVDRGAGSLSPVKESIAAQKAKYGSMAALATPPTSPTAAVTWITNYIESVLKPMMAPAVTLPAQEVQLTAKVAELGAAVARAKDRIPDCDVTMPSI
jgi:hypothetical protein